MVRTPITGLHVIPWPSQSGGPYRVQWVDQQTRETCLARRTVRMGSSHRELSRPTRSTMSSHPPESTEAQGPRVSPGRRTPWLVSRSTPDRGRRYGSKYCNATTIGVRYADQDAQARPRKSITYCRCLWVANGTNPTTSAPLALDATTPATLRKSQQPPGHGDRHAMPAG